MVAAAPNRTTVEGVVSDRQPHPTVDRWDLVTLRVDGTGAVEGYPDLLSRRVAEQGGELRVAVDREELAAAEGPDALPGRRLSLVATLAGPDVVRAVGPVRSSPAS